MANRSSNSFSPRRRGAPPVKRNQAFARGRMEALEPRTLLAAAPGSFTFADDFESADVAAWQVHLQTPSGFNGRGTGGYRDIGHGKTIQLAEADRGKALRITYEKDEDRGQAVAYLPAGGAEYVRTRQAMKFGAQFDFGAGQKIHRVWGMDETTDRLTFDMVVVVWAKPLPGRAELDFTGVNDNYLISVNYNGGPNDWGADWAEFKFERGRWYDIVTELKLNDVGQANGAARVWIDGVLVLEKTGLVIRDSAHTVTNRVLFGGWYSNSASGQNPAPDPAVRSELLIDNVEIHTAPAVPPPAALPQVSISDVTLVEGTVAEGGVLRSAEFVVSAETTAADFAPITLDYATVDGAAVAGADYLPRSGSITLTPTSRTARIAAPVIADALREPNERFFVRLANVRGGELTDGEGAATIVDDDAAPTISISDVQIVEGTGPGGPLRNAQFVIRVDATAAWFPSVTVNYRTVDGSARAGFDYQARRGSLTFTPARRSATISVPIIGDALRERNETFSVRLSGAIHALIADSVGVATIIDDDLAASVAAQMQPAREAGAGESAAPSHDLALWALYTEPHETRKRTE